MLLLLPVAADAQYDIVITAPGSLRELLQKFLDISRYQDRTDLDDDQFNMMLANVSSQVEKLLSTEGYFSPHTVAHVEQAEQANGKKRVILNVDPGPRVVIDLVELAIVGDIPEDSQQRATIIKNWPLSVGKPFRQEDWDNAKQSSLQALRNHRYAAAEITQSDARVLADEHKAALSATLDSGPAFTLGPLNIKGAQRYPAGIVNNLSPLREGEAYDVETLLSFQRQLLRSSYYSNAIIDINRDAANAVRAPVNVEVTEFPTQRLRAGTGYSSDTGANIEGLYAHNDVFGKAWRFEAQSKIEQKRQQANLNLAMPPDGSSYINSANYSYLRTTLEGIDLRSERYGLWRSRTRDKLDIAWKLQLYRDNLLQLDGAQLPSDIVVRPGNHQALVASVEWTTRKVDNLVFPRRGYIVSNDLGIAFKGLLTDETFVRAETSARRYFPVGERDIVIVKGSLGAVVSKGGDASIPASLLFRAGGTDSLRGYSYLSIGNEINGTVYPSRYLATGSLEYQRWFLPQWGVAVFYDVGTVTDNWADKQIFQGVGLGARWRSPIGPVNADLGYGIERQEIRPHFSLGVAF